MVCHHWLLLVSNIKSELWLVLLDTAILTRIAENIALLDFGFDSNGRPWWMTTTGELRLRAPDGPVVGPGRIKKAALVHNAVIILHSDGLLVKYMLTPADTITERGRAVATNVQDFSVHKDLLIWLAPIHDIPTVVTTCSESVISIDSNPNPVILTHDQIMPPGGLIFAVDAATDVHIFGPSFDLQRRVDWSKKVSSVGLLTNQCAVVPVIRVSRADSRDKYESIGALRFMSPWAVKKAGILINDSRHSRSFFESYDQFKVISNWRTMLQPIGRDIVTCIIELTSYSFGIRSGFFNGDLRLYFETDRGHSSWAIPMGGLVDLNGRIRQKQLTKTLDNYTSIVSDAVVSQIAGDELDRYADQQNLRGAFPPKVRGDIGIEASLIFKRAWCDIRIDIENAVTAALDKMPLWSRIDKYGPISEQNRPESQEPTATNGSRPCGEKQ